MSDPAGLAKFRLHLLCHPATHAPVVRSIEVHGARATDGGLELAYCLRGDMARLRIPAPEMPGCNDGLWEHTCFEAFISVHGEGAYREFNFSPSGQWATYDFSTYRQRRHAFPLAAAPQITSRLYGGRIELEVVLSAPLLPPGAAAATVDIGLSAVVEAADLVDGSHSYWALYHPSDLPDFHHRDAFALELASPHNHA